MARIVNPYASSRESGANQTDTIQFTDLLKLSWIPIAFAIPAFLVLGVSWQCVTDSVPLWIHNTFVPYVLFGGHTLILILLFVVAIALAYNLAQSHKKTLTGIIAVFLASVYISTGFISWWLMFGVAMDF